MKIIASQVQSLDTRVFLWIQQHAPTFKVFPVIRFISKTGDGWAYAMLVFSIQLSGIPKSHDFFTTCVLAYLIEVPLYLFLKQKFKRNRPQNHIRGYQAKINPIDEFSFPSGHTTSAFVMNLQVIYFFPALAVPMMLWALSIGSSRVLLGVHFPGDIIAGSILGTLCSLLALFITTM